ncbi:MAG: carboxypeptidase-like regulatory domain-containing protein [Candidatus Doudnabacteria bacterium]|nr:carboxypeptidase-like regulatory domain-containing protein [Candidatus Doudnabacteria bacterium]
MSGFFAFFAKSAFASSTDGTIDLTYKYAWGENIGWVNFKCDNCNVHVTDSALSGYALSETVGWINLEDVVNDGQGNLSGYAWGENVGYIKFNPATGGVIINSSGEFTGSALGENIGWIIFGGDYKVKTDWRPQSARPACNNSSDDDGDGKTDYSADPGCSSLDDTDETDPVAAPSGGGGGGLPPEAYNPPTAPEGGFKILINENAAETDSRKVTLTLKGGSNTKAVWISENSQFPEGFQVSYNSSLSQVSITFDLSLGEGARTVYAKFCTQWGRCSDVVSDSIIRVGETVVEKIIEVPKKIVEEIKKIPGAIAPLIPGFLKPKPSETAKPPEVPIEELVSKEAPLAFRGKWQLLPSEPIREFVLAPLPKGIRNLAQKFPELEKTLEEVGVSKITDVAKLKSVKLTLPGLTERVGLPTAKIEPGKFALPQGVPVAKLSPAIKQQLPTEIVFAKTGGELVDFNIALSVNDKGEPQQKIQTISGKPLQLVVKPDKPVKSVKGYVVFKSKASQPTSLELPRNSLLASVIFAIPVFAKTQDQPVRVEEKLVLLEFEYTDPDGDGIYTAEIQAPLIEGEYEIITVMDFDDPELGKKEIRLTTVVDPEGYIYERDGDKETRIPGAIVSLYWLNPETKQYEMWPAKEYQQENPQTTDVRGTYSFLVPEGYYYLKAETPGYLVYDGKPFEVKEGSGIHINIELKTKYWWLKIVDWKTILLAIVIILLLYNFYRDKIRERLARSKNL